MNTTNATTDRYWKWTRSCVFALTLMLRLAVTEASAADAPFQWRYFVDQYGRDFGVDILMDLRRPRGDEEIVGRWQGRNPDALYTIARDGSVEFLYYWQEGKVERSYSQWFVTEHEHPLRLGVGPNASNTMVRFYVFVYEPPDQDSKNWQWQGIPALLKTIYKGCLSAYSTEGHNPSTGEYMLEGTNMPASWRGPVPMTLDGTSRLPVYAEMRTIDMFMEENRQYSTVAKMQGSNQYLYCQLERKMQAKRLPQYDAMVAKIRRSIDERTRSFQWLILQFTEEAEQMREVLLGDRGGSPVKKEDKTSP